MDVRELPFKVLHLVVDERPYAFGIPSVVVLCEAARAAGANARVIEGFSTFHGLTTWHCWCQINGVDVDVATCIRQNLTPVRDRVVLSLAPPPGAYRIDLETDEEILTVDDSKRRVELYSRVGLNSETWPVIFGTGENALAWSRICATLGIDGGRPPARVIVDALTTEEIAQTCHDGDVATLRKYVDDGLDVDDVRADDCLAFTRACYAGQAEVAQILVDLGLTPEDINEHGVYSLWTSCAFGYPEIVRLLFRHGLTVQAVRDDIEHTLWTACWSGYTEIVRVLIDAGVNADDLRQDQCAALIHSVRSGDNELVRMILSLGLTADDVRVGNNAALLAACERSDVETVRLLLDVGLTAEDMRGDPLYGACVIDRPDNIRLMISRGLTAADIRCNHDVCSKKWSDDVASALGEAPEVLTTPT